jgi:arabinogalactan endo-1,4-beta-galactosidase
LPSFILGADISSVQEAVEGGARYVDTDGVEKGMLQILRNHGFNFIRLRTFVNPAAGYGYASGSGQCSSRAEPYCDRDHTLEFARQVKEAGFGLLLDFHYSDTWADPGKQIIPEAWRDATTIEALAARLRSYTADVVGALASAGARPDLVQIGNEITPGMLLHVPDSDTDCWGNGAAPRASGVTGSSSNAGWPNLAALLRAGSEAVRSVDPSIQIVLHLENTESASGVRSWVNGARSRGVDFDVLGLSCYPAFQGEPSGWENTFRTIATEFPELGLIVAEYNPERTRTNLMMRGLPGGRGLGTFFWEPTQSGEWGQALFSYSNGAFRANAADFQEFDRLRQTLGL